MKNKRIRKAAFTICLLFTAVISIGYAIAYLTSNTGVVSFSFTVPEPGIETNEDLYENTKNNVRIENTGNVDSFIRATAIFTWQNEKGEILSELPEEGVDYDIIWNTSDTWKRSSDGFYYCVSAVPGKEGETTYSTDVLFTGCTPLRVAPVDGYRLNVEILSQSFHASPEEEIEAAWLVEVSDGKITAVN